MYYLADVLTLMRGIFAIFLFWGTVQGSFSPEMALLVFAGGEICDAFDGMCARRWRYPDDGKRRWWREHAERLDQVADVALAIACALFLVVRVPEYRYWSILLVRVAGVSALTVQSMNLIVKVLQRRCSYSYKLAWVRVWMDGLLLGNRYVYLAGIAGAISILVLATSWPEEAKALLFVVGIVIGIVLVQVKRNRLTEVKTR